MTITALILGLVSLVYGCLTVRDYLRGGYNLSAKARVWLRVCIIFAVVAVLLVLLI